MICDVRTLGDLTVGIFVEKTSMQNKLQLENKTCLVRILQLWQLSHAANSKLKDRHNEKQILAPLNLAPESRRWTLDFVWGATIWEVQCRVILVVSGQIQGDRSPKTTKASPCHTLDYFCFVSTWEKSKRSGEGISLPREEKWSISKTEQKTENKTGTQLTRWSEDKFLQILHSFSPVIFFWKREMPSTGVGCVNCSVKHTHTFSTAQLCSVRVGSSKIYFVTSKICHLLWVTTKGEILHSIFSTYQAWTVLSGSSGLREKLKPRTNN